MELMSRLSTFCHGRSLTLACAALCLSVLGAYQALSLAVELSKSPASVSPFAMVWTVSLCVAAFGVCIHAIWNLIADVGRGYSPSRCQVAAVLLFFAVAASAWLVYGLITAVVDSRQP